MRALVLIDIQNDFIDGALANPMAQAAIPNIVEKVKNHQGPIYVTYDTHDEDYLYSMEGHYLPVKHCIKGTNGWEMNNEVEKALNLHTNIIQINKPTFGYDSWAAVDVDENITQFELIGFCTDICVVSNALALKATFPNIEVLVDSSCCAGVTKESHEAALLTMKMCQVDVF